MLTNGPQTPLNCKPCDEEFIQDLMQYTAPLSAKAKKKLNALNREANWVDANQRLALPLLQDAINNIERIVAYFKRRNYEVVYLGPNSGYAVYTPKPEEKRLPVFRDLTEEPNYFIPENIANDVCSLSPSRVLTPQFANTQSHIKRDPAKRLMNDYQRSTLSCSC